MAPVTEEEGGGGVSNQQVSEVSRTRKGSAHQGDIWSVLGGGGPWRLSWIRPPAQATAGVREVKHPEAD